MLNEWKKEVVDATRNARKAQRDLALNNFTNLVANVVDSNRRVKKNREKDNSAYYQALDSRSGAEKTLAANAEMLKNANKKYNNNLKLSTNWYARHGYYGDAQNAKDETDSTLSPEKEKEVLSKTKPAYRQANWYNRNKAEQQAEDVVSPSGRKKLETRRWHKELDSIT